MPESRWKGYIKDYSGSTMMQCKIHKTIDYQDISQTIKSQREFVIAQIKQVMNRQVYSALQWKGEQIQFENVAGLLEAGWTKKAYEESKGNEEKTFEQ